MRKKINKTLAEVQQHVMVSMNSGVDFESRTIYLVGEVDAGMFHRFVTAFEVMDRINGHIRIVLSTPGGSEPDGYAIYDMMRMSRNPIIVEGYGSVQSIGALILQGADLRLLAPECRVMIHNGSVEFGQALNTDTLVAIGKEVGRNNKRYQDVLASRSNLPSSKVKELVDQETYMSAAECVQWGFADGILNRRQLMIPKLENNTKNKKKAKKKK
ncbi:hypothetical protein EBZ38_08480 [bacterium]|nr:hypothetical protein [bacterium]